MNNLVVSDKKIEEGFVGQKTLVLPPHITKTISKNNFIRRFYFTNIGYYPNASYHDRERVEGCDQYILLYCVEGVGSVTIDNVVHVINPNSYLILPKTKYHHYKSSKEDPWSIYWVHFSGEQADILFSKYKENTYGHPVSIPYDERRISDFDDVFDLIQDGFENDDLEIANIKLLNLIASLVYLKQLDPILHEVDVITNSIKYMKTNVNKRKTVTDFARQQNLSVSHYTKLFKTKTGVPPLHFFNKLKIQKSCQFLYFTDRNVKEICAAIGFDDQFYFSRLFKNLIGMSPIDYRNHHKARVKSSDVVLKGN